MGTRPLTGVLKIDVRTSRSSAVTARGRPTLTERILTRSSSPLSARRFNTGPIQRHGRYNRVRVTSLQSRDELSKGNAALVAGEWEGALSAFQRALSATETPEALEGLGLAG